MRESEIEKYLVKRVKELGGEVRKVKWIGRMGAPDRVVWLPTEYTMDGRVDWGHEWWSRSFWCEVKRPGEKPEPHQLREHARMRKMGQRVEVVDSFEAVDSVLS